MIKSRLPALLVYKESVYRPAGYRVPNPGEKYVSKAGHIKRANPTHLPGPRLIVRPYSSEDFGG